MDIERLIGKQQRDAPELSPSYTLAELMELGHEWARSTGGELTDDMAVSWFLLWLGKKEREGNERSRTT